MTAKKKTTTGKGEAKRLKPKKETFRDLDVTSKARAIKGGRDAATGLASGRRQHNPLQVR